LKPAKIWHWKAEPDRSKYLLGLAAIGFLSEKLVIDYLGHDLLFSPGLEPAFSNWRPFGHGWQNDFDWRPGDEAVLALKDGSLISLAVLWLGNWPWDREALPRTAAEKCRQTDG